MTRHGFGVATVVAILAGAADTTCAASTCYDDRDLFPVYDIAREAAGLRIALGPRWWTDRGQRRGEAALAPSLSWERDAGWRRVADVPVPRRRVLRPGDDPYCADLVPAIPLGVEQATRLRSVIGEVPPELLELEQRVDACHRTGNVLWFGIAFYSGEGITGVGGVGRYDLDTEQLEIRRPDLLRSGGF